MGILESIVLISLAFFVIYQAYSTYKTFMKMRESVRFIKDNKQNIVVRKDYWGFVISYGLLAVFMAMYAALFIYAKSSLYGALFALLSVFCLVFLFDSIANRTLVFYDGGFLCAGKTFKYRQVQSIEEKSRILRGSEVRIMGEGLPVYVSKKSKVILEERMHDYKVKSKKRK